MRKGYDYLGEKIKMARTSKGYSQRELGDALGLPKQSVSMIEKGGRRITREELEKACRFLGVPVEFMLKEGMVEQFLENQEYEPKNPWGIMVPPFIDDILTYQLEMFLEELIDHRLSTKSLNIKYIKNIIKGFQLFLKDYKESD